MPAETHSYRDDVDVKTILDLVASLVGLDPDTADGCALAALELDGDLAMLHLWEVVAEEFGERSLGEFEPPDPPPATLGELVEAFQQALSS